ncbi:cation-transporting P-type ATPase [Alteromonas stellipolaris]|uniref:cation-transporting P-type ATPase n=1 Tax=Alteromonas stellipolaris TaxID=233316 RepID=UPI0009F86055
MFSSLDSLKEGLAPEHVAVRIEKFGLNNVVHAELPNLIFRFLYQFKSLLVFVVAVILTVSLQHWLDASVLRIWAGITVQTTLSHFSFALCLHQGQKCPDAMPI